MGTFILILFAHVGSFGKTDSNSLASVEFANERACIAAGNKAKDLVRGTVKNIEFVCVAKS